MIRDHDRDIRADGRHRIRAGRSKRRKRTKLLAYWLAPALIAGVAVAGDFNSGSDGSDGVFAPAGSTHVIDLSQAMTATWDTPNTDNPGAGVYDPDLWCVVFKYDSVIIPQNTTVRFLNHPAGAPVVWLVQNSVNIGGTIDISGANYVDCNGVPFRYAWPGPGGFAGGAGQAGAQFPVSSGFGPGGGLQGAGAVLAMANRPYLSPLIGGSGGGGSSAEGSEYGGGAGGGAMLIAAEEAISFTESGLIDASGGNGAYNGSDDKSGGGSGGSVRLVTPAVMGSIAIDVNLGECWGCDGGGQGHVRVESLDLSDAIFNEISPSGEFSLGSPGLALPPSNRPRIQVISCGGVAVPPDPLAAITSPDVIVDSQAVEVTIEAVNVPLTAAVEIQVRPAHGVHYTFSANPLDDDDQDGIATSTTIITLPELLSASVQATAAW